MDFQTLLSVSGIADTVIALCLHKPGNSHERAALCRFAEAEPALFEAYQATHSAIAEATLKRRGFMASFLARLDGELTFYGLYRQAGWKDMNAADLDARPDHRIMRARIGSDTYSQKAAANATTGRALFDLQPLATLSDLRGRLIVADPGGRAYMRLGETTPLPILEITRTPSLAPPMPEWDTLTLTTDELRSLPRDWAATLTQWRGIYLLTDESDGGRYVGAAYGADNLLGRWRAHAAGEYGVTKELSKRSTARFRFSILELLSPVALIDAVTQAEQSWITRLHTRHYGLNQ